MAPMLNADYTDCVSPGQQKENLVSIRGVTKSFADIVAVNGIDLDIYSGEILGLLGPNGAGKTTLISMLVGILKPDQGQIIVDGYDLAKDINEIKKIVSVVPQDFALYLELTAYENVAFFAGLYGLKGKLKQERIAEVLEIAQLQAVAKKKVGSFSGGMKRRLNLAIGLLNRPKLVLLDEPTAGIDPQSRNHIFESIHRLVNEYHMSVLYTTHYMEEAETLCDRIAIYDRGQILAVDTTDALLAKHGKKQFMIKVEAEADGKWLLKRLEDMDVVDEVTFVDHTLFVSARELLKCTEMILRIIREEGITVNHFNVRQSDLEGVFLKLTGKKLRD